MLSRCTSAQVSTLAASIIKTRLILLLMPWPLCPALKIQYKSLISWQLQGLTCGNSVVVQYGVSCIGLFDKKNIIIIIWY